MNNTFFVTLDMNAVHRIICEAVIGGSFTGELIDSYTLQTQCGICGVLVFEKHYTRTGNRLTLTVVLDSFTGTTRVHCTGGGGGQGLFRFDWGASGSFENVVQRALEPYIIRQQV